MAYYLIFAALSGALSVILGAFGAHALRATLSPDQLAVWHTGVQYQFVHTLALLAVVALGSFMDTHFQKYSALCFCLGIILFSGSLYVLTLTQYRTIGFITPIGGVLFIVAWVLLAIAVFKKMA